MPTKSHTLQLADPSWQPQSRQKRSSRSFILVPNAAAPACARNNDALIFYGPPRRCPHAREQLCATVQACYSANPDLACDYFARISIAAIFSVDLARLSEFWIPGGGCIQPRQVDHHHQPRFLASLYLQGERQFGFRRNRRLPPPSA